MNPLPILLGGVVAALAALGAKKAAPQSGTYELDQGLPPAFASQVLGALANERDPAKLLALAAQMQTQGYPLAANALRARAAELGGGAPPAPKPSPGPSPKPPPSPHTPPGTPAGVIIDVSPDDVQAGHSVHAIMTADEWNQTMVMLNDWLAQHAKDPALAFIDLSFYRGNVDDLGDTGNFELAVDALQAWLNQTGNALPPGGVPGQTAGTLDAYTAAGLYLWGDANSSVVHANEALLAPFSAPLVAAVKQKLGATTTAGMRPGGRRLPNRLALRRR